MLSKIIKEENITAAKKLINSAEHIVITAHISPDGDAVGATLGLYHFLKEVGKEVVVILPNRFPAFLDWMPGAGEIVIMEEKTAESVRLMKAANLIFCVDYNSIDRINGLKPLMEQSKAKKIMIDHHPYPGDFCDVTISYPEISSASELVFRFICRMGYFQEITLEGAECIYTGMMTDTGGFTYNSNSAEIYSIIYELINKGIDKDAIYRRVFNTYSADRMKLMGYCLSKMVVMPEEHTAYIVLTQEEKRRFNYKVGDTEGFVNMPLQIEGICKSVFVREDTDKVKLSFRSQGDVPVNTWAAEFGGGGHLNAAGGESYLSLEETIKKLVEIIKRDK